MTQPKLRFAQFDGDWEQKTLGEIAENFTGGGTPDTRIKNFWNGQIPWIQSSDIQEDNVLEITPKKFISKKGLQKSATKLIPENSIAVVTRVGVGKVLLVPFEYTTSQDFLSISNLKIDILFATYSIYRILQTESQKVQGTSIKGITKADLLRKFINIPTNPAEQTTIGNFFRQLDKLIALHQGQLDKVKTLKKGLLQKMFPAQGETVPQIRFPQFTDAWEQRKLGEVTKRVRGNDGRMNLPTLTMSASSGWLNQIDRFSSNIAGNEQKNYTLLKKGQLSYNHGNSKLAKYGVVFELTNHDEALVPKVYHSFETNKKAVANFLEYMFATKLPDRELRKLVSSGARMDGLLNISYDDFMGIKITIPDIKEQTTIGNFFRQFDDLINLHQRKLEHLKALKKSLLQQMFV